MSRHNGGASAGNGTGHFDVGNSKGISHQQSPPHGGSTILNSPPPPHHRSAAELRREMPTPPGPRGDVWCSCLCVRLPRPSQFLSPRWLLAFLCLAAIVQGMIFTNVVISSIERRFGLHSTQSGIIAGSYDFGSLLAVIPVTYYGGRPGASKPKYIATGMFIMGTGSLIFASPHFITNR